MMKTASVKSALDRLSKDAKKVRSWKITKEGERGFAFDVRAVAVI